MLNRLPIRIRVTLVFAAAMALVLFATGVFVYFRVGSSLSSSLNQSLAVHADEAGAVLRRAGGNLPDVSAGRGVVQVLGRDGRIVRTAPQVHGGPLLTRAEVARALDRRIRLDRPSIAGLEEGGYRLLATPVQTSRGRMVAVVAGSLEPREETLHHLLGVLLLGGAGALLLASLAGYALAAAALRPVEAMSRKAAAISLGGEMERLPVPPSRDEIASLGERLNEMLERIEEAFAHERRFLADASHELRTPLAIMKTELELALRRPRSREQLEGVLRSAGEETDRLVRLAEDLLVVARVDQQALPLRVEPSPAGEIVENVADRFRTRAGLAHRRIVTRTPPGLGVRCDAARMEQALGNLVENALLHGAGDVTIDAQAEDGWIEFHVSDEGDGFPTTFLPRAFERFSRADEARSGCGSGLGLAIVEAIADAHGGRAGAENRPGGGSVAWLALPKDAT